MPDDLEQDDPVQPRPWWAAGDPAWKSPWRMEEDEPALTRRVRRAAPKPPDDPRAHSGVVTRAENGGQTPAPGSAVQPSLQPLVERTQRHTEPKPRPVQQQANSTPTLVEDGEADSQADLQPRELASSHRHRRARQAGRSRTSWSSLVLMSLAVLALTFVAWLYQADAKSVEDEDLRIAAPPDVTPVITSPSRLEVFLESVQPVPGAGLAAKSPWDWETAVMARWLVDNGQALDNLKDLLEDSDWHGRHASWHLNDLGSHRNWAAAAILKQVEAAYMQRRGEDEAALAALLDLAELARRLQDILAWPSFFFRSLETHRRAAESLAELLPRCEADEAVLAAVQKQFEACEPQDGHVRSHVLPAFYLHEKKLLLGPQSGMPLDTMPAGVQRARSRRLFFKINETLGMMAATFRYLTRQVGQQSAASITLRDVWSGVPGVDNIGYYQPNGAGVAYASERLKLYFDVPARQQLARARHLLIVQLFAMRRFVLREKGLPASLTDLTPRYLRELPRDPFTGDLFHYDAARGLIYSAGSDLQPRGGRPDLPPLADPGEPTVRLGVRTAGGG